jgi:dihydrofolate synthase/folylpolyglutamate synthase
MRLGLDAMRQACARADHPELAFTAAHVAGTNGKGSTCAMLESMARTAGKKTGLYTSPHLCRFAERIRVDGVPLDDATLADVLERALDIGDDLSFFETATLTAFLAFRDAHVDVAIIEAGIGGRLDATNVIAKPAVTAITRVALDHTDRLGTSLPDIAREKAGIARAGVPMVLGPMPPDVRTAAIDVLLGAGALPIVMGEDPDALARESMPDGLRGTYQLDNARIAARMARELGISEACRLAGLAKATWPGRFEHLRISQGVYRGAWILDGAHNPDGIEALVLALEDDANRGLEKLPGALVFGAMADKAWPSMLDALSSLHCARVYVAPSGRDAALPATLSARSAGVTATSVAQALTLARNAAGDESTPVLVCGSLYLIGEARALLLDLPSDPPVAL